MIKTDGKPTVAWGKNPRDEAPAPRVAKDREQYKRELAERTKRESLEALK
ncbi:MAG: hypothetical protein ACXVHL_35860 [Solirubrobacteraceae bacterium]